MRRIYIEEKEKNCGKKEEKKEKREVNRNKIVKSHEKKRKTSKSVQVARNCYGRRCRKMK